MKLHKRITIQINKKERPRMHSTLLVTTHHQLFFMVLTIVPICTTSRTLTFLNYNNFPLFIGLENMRLRELEKKMESIVIKLFGPLCKLYF